MSELDSLSMIVTPSRGGGIGRFWDERGVSFGDLASFGYGSMVLEYLDIMIPLLHQPTLSSLSFF